VTDIVLISLYELGRQPLGVASALAFLRRAGLDADCLDLAVTPFDDAALERCACARLVAISVPMHTALRLAGPVAATIRARAPAVTIGFFGLYAPLHAAALGGDFAIGGEHEEELVRRARGDAPGADVTLRRLAYPRPARDALPPPSAYARLVLPDGTTRLAGSLEATRGCRHLCRHCPVPAVYGGRFFAVPIEVVVADAAQQVAAGVRHFTFADADFLNAPKHALAAARALHAAHPEATFDVTTKIEHIRRHPGVFPELARLGCVFVVSAVESLSDRVLDILAKGHRAADVAPALAVVRAAGLSLRPTFLPFTPWTTAADVIDLVHFIHDHDLLGEVDPVQLTLRLLIPPGSLLLGRPELAPHLGGLDAERGTYVWRHPDPRLDALQLELQALVERAAEDGAEVEETFAAIHARVAAAHGGGAGSLRPRRRPATAHLSEPWFC
jgi:radical SAM superfamily enzyme YgiQ (UPF0313 family)